METLLYKKLQTSLGMDATDNAASDLLVEYLNEGVRKVSKKLGTSYSSITTSSNGDIATEYFVFILRYALALFAKKSRMSGSREFSFRTYDTSIDASQLYEQLRKEAKALMSEAMDEWRYLFGPLSIERT